MTIEHVFTDGGLFSANPSPHGGAWCFVGVTNEQLVLERSGIILPADVSSDRVTNNAAELWAAVEAIEAMPDGWSGTLWTDSRICAAWLLAIKDSRLKKIPSPLRTRLLTARRRSGIFRVRLVAGHPTLADLARGCDAEGNPVSKWNKHCDQVCTRLARQYKAQGA